MSTVYFTADLHIGHEKVSALRGFQDTYAHDEELCDVWSGQVTKRDTIWVLGDLAVGNPTRALEIIASLPGEKHLIIGNHDTCHPMFPTGFRKAAKYLEVFGSVQLAASRVVAGKETMLSHFPYQGDHSSFDRHRQWRLRDLGAPLIHGHIHSDTRIQGHQLHVGWDAWGHLVPLSEIEHMVKQL